MRKYISILLLFILLFNIGGYEVWFGVVHYNIQKEIAQTIKKGLKEEELTRIEISANHLSAVIWLEAGKEFIFNGEMYDVVSKKFSKSKTIYYCINDQKEEQLIAGYTKKHPLKTQSDEKTKRIFSLQYFPHTVSLKKNDYTSIFIRPILIFLYKSAIIDIQAPPPKV